MKSTKNSKAAETVHGNGCTNGSANVCANGSTNVWANVWAQVSAVIGAVLLLAAASPARAQNAVTGGDIHVHATFHNVGITATLSGDDNGDAVANLEVNVDGQGYRPAHRLSRAGADRFVGSAFFLDPGTSFSVRVTLSDPDGVTNGQLEAQGTTRDLTVPTGHGATYHVSEAGDDNGQGTESSPFVTIAHALDQVQPGDTVVVHAGTYHEEVHVPAGGTQGHSIVIAAAGDGPAVMDGADPDLKASSAWSDEGGHLYSASVSQTRYVAVDGVRLWRYESLSDLQNLTTGTNGGFFFDGSTVHVRLPGDAAPAGHEIQVSTLGRALWLEGTPNMVVSGLTIRCYGSEEYSEGIMVRDGSNNVWIVDNVFENVMPGIWVKNDVSDLTVMGNEFSDRGLAEFPWHEVKSQGGMESGALGLDNQYNGQGIVFYQNVVHDSFDGLHICGDVATSAPNNADVMENLIYHLGDDGIETDGISSNVRILRNRFSDCLCGVSVAPAVDGPTYVIGNFMVDLGNVAPGSDWMTRALKFNVGDDRPSGEVFVYHNTSVVHEQDQAAFAVTDDSKWTHVFLLDNIWQGTQYAFYYVNAGDEPFDEDYDLIYSTGDRLVEYQGDRYGTIDAYHSGTGQCEHCVSAPPLFEDETGGDYRLTTDSPAVDTGVPIPGVDDDYAGNAPDLGAVELGKDSPVGPGPDAGPRADASARTDGGVQGQDGATGSGSGSGGCSCRQAETTGWTDVAWLPAAILFALLLMGLVRKQD